MLAVTGLRLRVALPAVRLLFLLLLLCCLCRSCAGVSSGNGTSSAPGVPATTTGSTVIDDGSSAIPSLPVSNLVALILGCGAVVGVCICLFVCAKKQMAVATRAEVGSEGKNNKLLWRLQAARNGTRKNAGRTTREQQVAMTAQAQRAAILQLGGGSMGGIGILKYSQFSDPEDFQDEPWATPETLDALKKSGLMLDIVLAAYQAKAMAWVSGLVPVCCLIAMQFHTMLLAKMGMSDWYGPITQIDFYRCVFIASAACGCHILAYIVARFYFHYDRTESVAKEREKIKLEERAEAQRKQTMEEANGGVATDAVTPMGPSSPTSFTHGVPDTPRAGNGNGVLPPAPPIPESKVAVGDEPPLWPLKAFCIAGVCSFALLGYQGYISCDDSIGRNYGFTSTPARYWPSSAGKAPAITLLLCIVVGFTGMITLAFDIRLLALFMPRKVHPNLMPHQRNLTNK